MSFVITNAGQAKVAEALADGVPITVADIAFGDEDRFPTGGETALSSEVIRKPVLASGVEGQKTFFDARLEADDGPFVLYEVGLFDDAGTLLFIGRIEGFNKLVLQDQTVTLDFRAYVLTSQFQNVVVQVDTSFAFVPAPRQVDTGAGLDGGGDLSADRTLVLEIGNLPSMNAAEADAENDSFAVRDADDEGNPAHKQVTIDEAAKMIKAATGFAHNHGIGDVTGLQGALDGKAAGEHGHAIADVSNLQTALDGKAPKASPSFTGNPTAPTQSNGNNSTRLATTAFVQAALAGAGGANIDVQEFPASGTWTKPENPKLVLVEVTGGGGGGGSGRRGPANSYRSGGGGGGGGGKNSRWFDASALDATENVIVGSGGAGGASVTADNTNGNNGSSGGYSSFSSSVTAITAHGGNGGDGGTGAASGGNGGSGGSGDTSAGTVPSTDSFGLETPSQLMRGGLGGSADGVTSLTPEGTQPYVQNGGQSVTGGGGGGASYDNDYYAEPSYSGRGGTSVFAAGGGGGGGSISATNEFRRGGHGGNSQYGDNGHGGETAGANATGGPPFSGGGGGGGAGNHAGPGGNGQDGSHSASWLTSAPGFHESGGGGGGGGASVNGYDSGAGGDGGDGYVRVITITG